ncbi:MAG: AmmeMemoRadiSam system protein B [Candidatus Omnitrophica bacterium]|nr:AmmeMemoRadiSam system protein B [Candidatus Omnitrophota bacterium]
MRFKRLVFLNVIFLSLILLPNAVSYAQSVQASSLDGTFYPKDKDELESMLERFFSSAFVPEIKSEIIAVIVPHAGYVYSGEVASCAFKALIDKGYNTVVVLGISHRHYFKGVSVLDKDAYITPLGSCQIDRDFSQKLIGFDEGIYFLEKPFNGENSIETQIPFIQYALPKARIAAVLIGDSSYQTCLLLQKALCEAIGRRKDVVIVISTDMSHFLPDKKARAIDSLVISRLEAFDPQTLYSFLFNMNDTNRPCGSSAIVSGMLTASELGAGVVNILRYANSGQVSGDYDSVVGYVSAVILRAKEQSNGKMQDNEEGYAMEGFLNLSQKKRLLQIARSSIKDYIEGAGSKKLPEDEDKVLNSQMGAFVSLHKAGRLRGCIGNIEGRGRLCQTVADMAVQSAVGDPRFNPVTADELDDIDIEISVLSPLKRINDPDEIIMGKHGVLVRDGFRTGVYLPQVAVETGWSREQFMRSLCSQKAGIHPDAWKTGACQIYVFTAEVFGEKENN